MRWIEFKSLNQLTKIHFSTNDYFHKENKKFQKTKQETHNTYT